jgi:hypothetical protein
VIFIELVQLFADCIVLVNGIFYQVGAGVTLLRRTPAGRLA